MSGDARTFFDAWVARNFSAGTPWTDLFPTPLAALTELRAQATLEGINEDDLRRALGDLVSALMSAMLDAPAPDPARFGTVPDLSEAGTAAVEIEMALNYIDGLGDAIGSDHGLAASLMLHYLARRGYVLRPLAASPEPDTDPPLRWAPPHSFRWPSEQQN